MGNRGGQETPADRNDKGSEDDATRATKKARVTRARAVRVMTETFPREERDHGHNNQLGTKAAATTRIVVAMTARATTTAARATVTGAKRATAMTAMTAMMARTAMMAAMATMMPNSNDEAKLG
jgi:hypothetical protein